MINEKKKSQLINAKYKLSDSEISFIVLVINQINEQDLESVEYIVKLSDFEEKIELSNSKIYFKQFVKKLISKTLEVPTENGFIIFNWFSKVEYKEIESIFIVNIHRELKNYLLNFKKQFIYYDLKYILPLTSNYSIKIYQLLKKYEELEEKSVELNPLMEYLEVPDSLQRYSEFKRKVLLVAQKELQEHTDIHFVLQELKDSRKITELIFYIYKNSKNSKDIQNIKPIKKVKSSKKVENNLFTQAVEVEIVQEPTKEIAVVTPQAVQKVQNQEYNNSDVKRIVTFFDQERRKLQANFVRKEYRNQDGEYQLRLHLKETGRTPKMFYDAIRWLFSNNPKASFHRQYIMNISKLIEHFNTLEHQAMYSQEAVKFDEETQVWYNIYKKQGLPEEEILQKLREGGYLQ